MAGTVQAWFSDSDLERILDWYGVFSTEAGFGTIEDESLAGRIARMHQTVACGGACKGGACRVE